MSPRLIPQVRMFTAVGCTYCDMAKGLLRRGMVEWMELDVDQFPSRFKAASSYTGIATVPIVFVTPNDIFTFTTLKEKLEREPDFLSNLPKVAPESWPEFLLPLTDAELDEANRRNELRRSELDYFDSVAEELRISLALVTDDRTGESVPLCDSFTYSDVLDFLLDPQQSGVSVGDHGGFFSKKPQCTVGQNLLDGIEKFLLSGNVSLGIPPSVAAITLHSVARGLFQLMLHPRMTMIYDINNNLNPWVGSTNNVDASTSNGDTAVAPSDELPSLTEKEITHGLFRFQVHSHRSHGSHWGNKLRLNGSRLLGSYVRRGSPPLSLLFPSSGAVLVTVRWPSNSQVVVNPVTLSRALWHSVNEQILQRYRDPADGLVDFVAAKRDSPTALDKVRQLLTLLQAVDLAHDTATDEQKMAFGINLYNSLLNLGFVEWGVPWSLYSKLKFFGEVGCLLSVSHSSSAGLGGQQQQQEKKLCFFSLNDLENGFLRGNRKGATDLFSLPFAASDPRLDCVVKVVDFRIHSGLNCGAKSCPPVRLFSADNLQNELELATTAFLRSTTLWDSKKKQLHCSQILKWYRQDFGPSLPATVLLYLDEELQGKILRDAGGDASSVDVVFTEYDWTFSAKP